MTAAILRYLTEKYHPLAVIAYGSFADGSNNAGSDFDALAILPSGAPGHNGTVVMGTELDVFLYPASTFSGSYDPADFVQVWDGKILLDTGGIAAGLIARVNAYLAQIPPKMPEENRQNAAWCEKMLLRTRRGDPEGDFRRHWLLVDSLEIWCDIWGTRYLGPKKSLRRMAAEDPESFRLYSAALAPGGDLEAWVRRLQDLAAQH